MKICGVKFKDGGKTYLFKYDEIKLYKNLTVIVDTEKGEQFAKVVDVDVQNLRSLDLDSMKSVIRVSTKNDYNSYIKDATTTTTTNTTN